jgi:hypothetical protein
VISEFRTWLVFLCNVDFHVGSLHVSIGNDASIFSVGVNRLSEVG